MHATIRRYDGVDQARTAEVTRKVNESLVPKLSTLPGFAGYYLIEAGNGVFSSLGLFETPEQGKDSSNVVATWIRPSVPSSCTQLRRTTIALRRGRPRPPSSTTRTSSTLRPRPAPSANSSDATASTPRTCTTIMSTSGCGRSSRCSSSGQALAS